MGLVCFKPFMFYGVLGILWRQDTCSWLFPHVQKHLPKEGQIESPNLPKKNDVLDVFLEQFVSNAFFSSWKLHAYHSKPYKMRFEPYGPFEGFHSSNFRNIEPWKKHNIPVFCSYSTPTTEIRAFFPGLLTIGFHSQKIPRLCFPPPSQTNPGRFSPQRIIHESILASIANFGHHMWIS